MIRARVHLVLPTLLVTVIVLAPRARAQTAAPGSSGPAPAAAPAAPPVPAGGTPGAPSTTPEVPTPRGQAPAFSASPLVEPLAPQRRRSSDEPEVPVGAIVVAYELSGTRRDPDERLSQLLATVAPLGSPYVMSGAADRVGGVLIGTLPRLEKAIVALGYRAKLTPRVAHGGVTIHVDLEILDRLRYIFVEGNRTTRQDEIQRRITVRAGRVLPPPGADRAAALERERGRVIEFLRTEGYFEANVRLDAVPANNVPGAVDLYVRINRGPGYPLGPLELKGNKAISSEEIDKIFRHRDWEYGWFKPVAFTQKRLRDDIDAVVKKYRELGYIGARVTHDFNLQQSVDRDAKNVHLVLTINERKLIQVDFEGNAEESDGTLRDKLTMVERGSYDDYELDASADALQRYYQQEGYFFARVDWRREHVADSEDRVTFVVDEGPELKVRGIEFVGAVALPPDELAEVVSVRPFPLLGYVGLGEGGYVTGRQIEQDAERLVEHYRGRGFPEVTARGEAATSREALGALGAIAAGAETDSRGASSIYVRYTIVEGPRVMLKSEDFKTDDGSPLPRDKDYLLESVSLRPGEPFTPAAVREDGRRLERLLGDQGYAQGAAEPETVRVGNDIHLTWMLKLGPRVHVGPTFVRGNFVTKDRIVLQQIPLDQGGLLTTTGFERGQRNLGFMQLFNNAAPISFPGREENIPVVPMVVDVEERYEQYSLINLGAGISTDQKPPDSSFPFGGYARVGYENRNLLGHGWGLTGALAVGPSLRRGTAGFLDRRFFGTLFRLDASLNYLQQATVRLGDIRSGGGSIGFSRELFPGVDAGVHYNLRNTTHTEGLIRSGGSDALQTNIQLATTVGSVSANLQWLRIDNRLLPNAGFKVDVFGELAVPALSAPLRPLPFPTGDDSFIKMGVHALSVIPVARVFFLRLGFRFDQGFPLGGASLLPKVERYFAGGDTTIRGYRLDRARTEVVQYPLHPPLYGIEYQPIGGNLRILQNIDFQFPISPPWYGSVFFDNGIVADSLDGLSLAQFRHGVGVSPLVLRLPIGDLSFAWAVPLDPGPGDTRIGVFHVNVGLLF